MDSPASLLTNLRLLVANALGLFCTRLALAGVELQEELQRLVQLMVYGAGVLVFAIATILALGATIVFAVEPEYRLWSLIGLTVGYAAIAGLFYWRIRCWLTERPPFLEATLAELAKDLDVLNLRPKVHLAEAEEPPPTA